MAALADHLRAVAPGVEVVVVDGGSDDGTADAARSAGLTVLQSAPGRSTQMNAGAAAATADLLLFLHADTLLPEGVGPLVERALADPAVSLGAFRFVLDRRGFSYGVIELGAGLRNRLAALPYGDQALFVRRATFDALGGFADLPILEDLDLVLRARALGRIAVLPEPAVTSSRRYTERGVFRLMLRHWWLTVRFRAGWRPGPAERVRR